MADASGATKRKQVAKDAHLKVNDIRSTSTFIDLTLSDDEAAPPSKRQKSTPPFDANGPLAKPFNTSSIAHGSHVTQPRGQSPFFISQRKPLVKPIISSATRVTPPTTNAVSVTPNLAKKSPFRGLPTWATDRNRRTENDLHRESSLLQTKTTSASGDGTESQHLATPERPAAETLSVSAHVSDTDFPPLTARRRESIPTAPTKHEIDKTKPLFAPSPEQSDEQPQRLLEDRAGRDQSNSRSSRLQTASSQLPPRSQKFQINIPRRSDIRFSPSPSSQRLSIRPASKSRYGPSPHTSSQISVVIPERNHNDPDDLLAAFVQPLPDLKKTKAEKQALYEELKRSADPVQTRLTDVERLLGQTGFSSTYSTEGDGKRLKALAQKKAKKVNRKHVVLDLGGASAAEPSPSGTPQEIIHPREQVRDILDTKFQERFNPPLTFANDVNSRQLSGKFQFVSDYILREGVTRADARINHGCQCYGVCSPASCLCLEKAVPDGFDADGEIQLRSELVPSYERRSDGLAVLTNRHIDVISARSEITECNQLCGCTLGCLNRVVQKGRTVPLEIFQTANECGFGVRSSTNIVRGQFIDLYLGEVITEKALKEREEQKAEKATSYTFTLDWWNEGANAKYYQIDGENFGSAMRFVNHSCNPNSKTFTVQMGHHEDKRIYYLAFFAVKDIPAGQEITIDYNPQLKGSNERHGSGVELEEDAEDDESEGIDEDESDVVLCRCGEPNCRRRLWPKARTQRKRRRRLRD